MRYRAIALVLCGGLVSCGAKGGDDDNEIYRTTFGYFLTTGNTSVSSVIMSIISQSDITQIQTQTGTTQTTGLGFITGRVTDAAGNPLAAVTVQAHNDSGLPAGSIFYQSQVSGAYVTGLTMTSATGRFVVMNVQPGRVNLKCPAGADGNLIIQVPGGTAAFVQLNATAPAVSTPPTWSGVTQNLGGTGSALPGSPEPSVNYQLIGVTSAPGPASDGTTGAFDLGTVAARSTFLVKCSKSGLVDTHTYIRTATANLTSGGGGGNVFITSTTNRDNELNAAGVILAAGTGIIRGRVLDGAGGFVVEARDGNDQLVGNVLYGDNAVNGKPDATLTATQTDGIFYVYNVPPGQVLLVATKSGFAANVYVEAFADGITLPLDLTPLNQTQATITLSGALVTLQGFAVPEGNIALHGLGIGDASDPFGEYSIQNVPTRHQLIVRTMK